MDSRWHKRTAELRWLLASPNEQLLREKFFIKSYLSFFIFELFGINVKTSEKFSEKMFFVEYGLKNEASRLN